MNRIAYLCLFVVLVGIFPSARGAFLVQLGFLLMMTQQASEAAGFFHLAFSSTPCIAKGLHA
jgi:hypothetical protein